MRTLEHGRLAAQALPQSVRYVKNGEGGQWWPAAKEGQQVHCGWSNVSPELLKAADLGAIEALAPSVFGTTPGTATRDRKALLSLIDRPSQHLWITFQDGFMWWCTVFDDIEIHPEGRTKTKGNFWLTCARPWSNQSMGGRYLAVADLPGSVTATAGFQGTVCEPKGSEAILRIIHDEDDLEAVAAAKAREAYEAAIKALIARLHPKDFEVLIDLILSRTGWARLAKLGGVTEGIDVEVENASTDEIAFVQVKSTASQAVLDDYASKFNDRRERYARMIFAVHTPKGTLKPPSDRAVQVWDGHRIAQLVVALGLGGWVTKHL